MKVLVTGGGGFLGSAICRLLQARGDDVTSLARSQYGALSAAGIRQIQGDVSSLDTMLAASAGCEQLGSPLPGKNTAIPRPAESPATGN